MEVLKNALSLVQYCVEQFLSETWYPSCSNAFWSNSGVMKLKMKQVNFVAKNM